MSFIDDLSANAAIGAPKQRSERMCVEDSIETLERIAAAGKLPRRRITREPVAPQR